MHEKILLMEDELSIQSILYELLTDVGYQVVAASDGVEGLAEFSKDSFDLILLDIMMPRLCGYDVCHTIRQTSKVPIIMLTALDAEDAQIKAFELHADDYITKPFSVKLILLRVEAILRRGIGTQNAVGLQSECSYKNIKLEPEAMRVYSSGKEVSLTKIEFDLLKVFLSSPDRVFTRDNLLNIVWGYEFTGDEKAVNIHIMNLRRKLGVNCIESIRGVGYRLAKD